MIICTGERVNDRSIPDARVERWRLARQGKVGHQILD